MTPIERFERESQELVDKYTERLNRDIKAFKVVYWIVFGLSLLSLAISTILVINELARN